MKVNQRVRYLSADFFVVKINEKKQTVTIRNVASKLRKPNLTVESKFVRSY